MSETISSLSFTQRDGYSIYQTGKHFSGSYIRVYIPDSAKNPGTPLKTITYLHGFALCMPSFYEKHLEELVKENYIVFFPDFQRSCYPNTPPTEDIPKRNSNLPHLKHWMSVGMQLKDEGELSIDETPILEEICEREDLGPGLQTPSKSEARSVGRSLIIIIIILKIWSWFQREYGKNLIHLLSTVGISLFHEATESLDNTINLTQQTWDVLAEHFPHWKVAEQSNEVEYFAFGHSLGGLVALSLPFGYTKQQDQRFNPQQIVVADPAASTEMGIPKFAIAILKFFRSPFTNAPILITETGEKLTVPVVILHGGADKLVPPKTWKKGENYSVNFAKIASGDKQVYFSYSNSDKKLVAFHNQAVTSTQYYDDGLFEHFGGVKDGPNAYNCHYVWPGLDLIISGNSTPQKLGERLQNTEFKVELDPPPIKFNRWKWLLILSLIFGALAIPALIG